MQNIQVGDSWEELVSVGQTIMEAHDRDRWVLGDLSNKVARRYGDESIRKYAAEINARTSTLYDYSRVSAFYGLERREMFPALTWSHYREAARLETLPVAVEWLEQAQDNGWPIAEMHRQINGVLGKPVPPKKLAECVVKVKRCTGNQVEFILPDDAMSAIREQWANNQAIRLVIYETQSDQG